MRGVGVAIVVATIVRDARLPDRCSPEFLDVGQALARDIAREEVLASRVLLENAGNQTLQRVRWVQGSNPCTPTNDLRHLDAI